MLEKKTRYVSDFEHIMKEWDWAKNNISPYETTSGSAKVAFWICSTCSHSWKTPIYSRCSNGCGCPECAKAQRGLSKTETSADKNNFLAKYPLIAQEWHPTKNTNIRIERLSAFSNVKVWWKCAICNNE